MASVPSSAAVRYSAKSAFTPSDADRLWWAENAPYRHENYEAADDMPPRRPGVPRGPQPRRRTLAAMPINDADVFLMTGSVG